MNNIYSILKTLRKNEFYLSFSVLNVLGGRSTRKKVVP